MKPIIDLIFPPELIKLPVIAQKQYLSWDQKFGKYSHKIQKSQKMLSM